MRVLKAINPSIYLSFSLFIIPVYFFYHSVIDNSYQKSANNETFFSPVSDEYENLWVDSVLKEMTLDEKIGQLFMVAAYPQNGNPDKERMTTLIKDYKIGGIIFFKCGPVAQANLTNYYQSISKTPVMIAGDYEWGLSMRMDSTVVYPRQMTLGAISNNKLIYDFGKEVARQCNLLRININFAPVIDINNNPANPVINTRSFGDDRENVGNKGIAYMLGLQDSKVMASAKHFPGHGDTETDSHKDLPVINHSKERLDSLEIYPFKKLINKGIGSVMIAHLNIPALDNGKNVPSSLSKPIVTGLLKEELNFKGLIFTDALGMQGVTKFYKPGETEVLAIMAGVDVLLMPKDVPIALTEIKNAIKQKKISEKDINDRCKKILKAKKWFGLNNYKPIDTNNLFAQLNSKEAKNLNNSLIEASLVLAVNNEKTIPLETSDSITVASVNIASKNYEDFDNTIKLYRKTDFYFIDKNSAETTFNNNFKTLKKYNIVIINLFETSSNFPYSISNETINFIEKLSSETKVVLTIFGIPYSLSRIKNPQKLFAVIHAGSNYSIYRTLVAQSIFGGVKLTGKLSVTAGNYFKTQTGFQTNKLRLKYSNPSEFDIDTIKLAKIDSVIQDAIFNGATPGATIMAIKNGTVFYYKSFGYHTYENKIKTQNDDIYDLASLTKILATTASVMKLYEEKKIGLNEKISKYIPDLNTTNKKDIIIKDILAHQAGLAAWLPFYLKTFSDKENNILDPNIISNTKKEKFNTKVAENMYILDTYIDTIYQRIYKSDIKDTNKYRYSDIGFILMYRVIENITGQKLKDFANENFYSPLGAYTLGYNPLTKFQKDKIMPSEDDIIFRKQTIQGYVHDYCAALTNGANGHAGLFSNANDVAKMMQMFMFKGNYGGKKYLDEKTLNLFTECAFCENDNRRALGFDRILKTGEGIPSKYASESSYGHSGFTGTFVWNDPENQLTYIFLSNRTYPSAENNKLLNMNVRTKIHDILYESFNDFNKTTYIYN